MGHSTNNSARSHTPFERRPWAGTGLTSGGKGLGHKSGLTVGGWDWPQPSVSGTAKEKSKSSRSTLALSTHRKPCQSLDAVGSLPAVGIPGS